MAAGTPARVTRHAAAAALAALVSFALLATAAPASAATGFDTPWTGSGSGTATVVSDGSAAHPAFSYATSHSGSWNFGTTSGSSRTVKLEYAWSGFHAYFAVTARLTAWVTHAGSTSYTTLVDAGPVNCCSPPSNGFSYSGEATFPVQQGDAYGFLISGSNGDATPNVQGTLDVTLPPDTAPPTTTVSPGPGEWGTALSVAATDDVAGVAATRCAVDPPSAPTSYADMSADACPSSLPDGTHEVYAASIDNAGNAETPVAHTVQIDATPPSTTDDAPSAWQNSPTTVTLTPSDGGSGVQDTTFTVDGGAPQTGTSVVIPADPSHSGDGEHTITYWTTDLAGNAETPHAATVRIDTTAPAVALTATSPLTLSEGASRTFAYTVDDPGDASGLATAPSCGTGGTLVPGSDAFDAGAMSGSFACAFPNGPASPTVGVTATDALNGTGAPASREVTVLNLAPRVRMAADNPLTAADGATQTYRYSFADPGGDAVPSAITDCGAHGTKVAGSDTLTATGGSFACTFSDGPATSLVTARATDVDGLTGNAGTQTVAVAAPVLVAPPAVQTPSGNLPAGDGSGTVATNGTAASHQGGSAPAPTTTDPAGSGATAGQTGEPGTPDPGTRAESKLGGRYTGRYAAPRRATGRPGARLLLTLTRADSAVTFTTRATLVCGTQRLSGVPVSGAGPVTGTAFTAAGTRTSRKGTLSVRALFSGAFSGTTARGALRLTATRRVHGRAVTCAAVRIARIALSPAAGT